MEFNFLFDDGAQFDGIIRAGFGEPAGKLESPIIPATSDLVLFTSGSTGEPTKVYRTIMTDLALTELGLICGMMERYPICLGRSSCGMALLAG